MRDAPRSPFTDLACWGDYGEARPVALGELGFGAVHFVSGNYFATLGVRAQLGRTLEPADDGGGARWSPVVVLSDAFWRRAMGADLDVTRRTVTLNGRRFAVVGVLPAAFPGLDAASLPDLVVPIGALEISAQTPKPMANARIWSLCRVVGRMAAGRTDDEARLTLERALAESIAAEPPPEPYDPPRVWVGPGAFGTSALRDATAAPLAILLTGVTILLLAACANIAGLLLARGHARHKEIATRLALGAPRRRLIRQLVTESLVLSAAGGLLGIALAFGLSNGAGRFLSQFVPTLFGADRALGVVPEIDGRVLLVAVVVTLASGLAFGVGPALGATRLDLIAAIRRIDGGWQRRGAVGGRLLVGAQAALAVLLLVASGLFVRTVSNLRVADLGFPQERLLYARVEPRSANLPQERRAAFFRDALERLARLPGVVAASAGTSPPLGGAVNVGGELTSNMCSPAQEAEGRPAVASSFGFVAPGYFATLGVRVVAGRELTWNDEAMPRAAADARRAIVNESLARRLVGEGVAVDRLVGTPVYMCAQRTFAVTVAGIVADVKTSGRADVQPTIYLPMGGVGVPVTLLVRTAGDPAALIPTVRRAVVEVNADIPTFGEVALPALRERTLRQERLLAILIGGFGAVTAAICALGIYALLAYAVSRRRSEIGIRMAIGAAPRDVVRLVARESSGALAAGVVVGLAASLAFTRLLGSLTYGVSAADPWVLGGALLTFAIVAAAAAALPARAATRVDPVTTLRQV
jgi:predicted permease